MVAVLAAEREQHVEPTVTIQVTGPMDCKVRLIAGDHQCGILRGAIAGRVKQLLRPSTLCEEDHRIAVVRLFGIKTNPVPPTAQLEFGFTGVPSEIDWIAQCSNWARREPRHPRQQKVRARRTGDQPIHSGGLALFPVRS